MTNVTSLETTWIGLQHMVKVTKIKFWHKTPPPHTHTHTPYPLNYTSDIKNQKYHETFHGIKIEKWSQTSNF